MKRLLLALALALTTTAFADAPKWNYDVSKTILQAGRENKLTFILAGRVNCGNCQATRKLINDGKVPVTADTFVIADIDIDNQKSSAEFNKKFKKEKFGNTLPLVALTDSHGKVLSTYSGFKSEEELTKIIEAAKAKAPTVAKK